MGFCIEKETNKKGIDIYKILEGPEKSAMKYDEYISNLDQKYIPELEFQYDSTNNKYTISGRLQLATRKKILNLFTTSGSTIRFYPTGAGNVNKVAGIRKENVAGLPLLEKLPDEFCKWITDRDRGAGVNLATEFDLEFDTDRLSLHLIRIKKRENLSKSIKKAGSRASSLLNRLNDALQFIIDPPNQKKYVLNFLTIHNMDPTYQQEFPKAFIQSITALRPLPLKNQKAKINKILPNYISAIPVSTNPDNSEKEIEQDLINWKTYLLYLLYLLDLYRVNPTNPQFPTNKIEYEQIEIKIGESFTRLFESPQSPENYKKIQEFYLYSNMLFNTLFVERSTPAKWGKALVNSQKNLSPICRDWGISHNKISYTIKSFLIALSRIKPRVLFGFTPEIALNEAKDIWREQSPLSIMKNLEEDANNGLLQNKYETLFQDSRFIPINYGDAPSSIIPKIFDNIELAIYEKESVARINRTSVMRSVSSQRALDGPMDFLEIKANAFEIEIFIKYAKENKFCRRDAPYSIYYADLALNILKQIITNRDYRKKEESKEILQICYEMEKIQLAFSQIHIIESVITTYWEIHYQIAQYLTGHKSPRMAAKLEETEKCIHILEDARKLRLKYANPEDDRIDNAIEKINHMANLIRTLNWDDDFASPIASSAQSDAIGVNRVTEFNGLIRSLDDREKYTIQDEFAMNLYIPWFFFKPNEQLREFLTFAVAFTSNKKKQRTREQKKIIKLVEKGIIRRVASDYFEMGFFYKKLFKFYVKQSLKNGNKIIHRNQVMSYADIELLVSLFPLNMYYDYIGGPVLTLSNDHHVYDKTYGYECHEKLVNKDIRELQNRITNIPNQNELITFLNRGKDYIYQPPNRNLQNPFMEEIFFPNGPSGGITNDFHAPFQSYTNKNKDKANFPKFGDTDNIFKINSINISELDITTITDKSRILIDTNIFIDYTTSREIPKNESLEDKEKREYNTKQINEFFNRILTLQTEFENKNNENGTKVIHGADFRIFITPGVEAEINFGSYRLDKNIDKIEEIIGQ